MRAIVWLLLLWPALAGAEHIFWMQDYYDANGGGCCARTDCRPADITVLNHRRGEVLLNGVPLTLPPGSLHRIPPEAHEPNAAGYWCYIWAAEPISALNVRCLFYSTPFW